MVELVASASLAGPQHRLPNLAYLVGAWPLTQERATTYLEKAAREAKEHTSWSDRDDDYDRALSSFVEAVYDDDALVADVAAFAERIKQHGWSSSMAQKLVQLTMPGVPDVYQGSELWDLSWSTPTIADQSTDEQRRRMLSRLDAGTDHNGGQHSATPGCPSCTSFRKPCA